MHWLWYFVLVPLLTYLLPWVYAQLLCGEQQLKKKYPGAKWAFITGSSSGIGKALAERCAMQGLNVVIAALDDELLSSAVEDLRKKFPSVQFRKCGVDLSDQDGKYMEEVKKATDDINVQVVFNNAGFIVTGFFHQVPLGKQMANVQVNAISAVRITHHFYNRMVDSGLRGCICITSSAAGCIPSPFAVMYSSTKAFLSAMAASLSVEARPRGIDVLAVHPSPVQSRFLNNTAKLDMFDLSYRHAWTPEAISTYILRSIGRSVWIDIGGFAVLTRLFTKFVDSNFLAVAFGIVAPLMPDYRRYDDKAKAN